MRKTATVNRFACWLAALLLSAAGLAAAALEAPLADAAEERDVAAVQALLQQGFDVNAAQVDGMTALHWAAYRDDLDAAKMLIEAGARVEAANRYGVTPLSLAAVNGSGSMIELLLGSGADSNTALSGGETVLMTAARTGKIEAVQALLAGGADVHRAEERRGQTALMWAAAEGHAAVLQALIDAGADFRARLESGLTPLLFAVREGRVEAVKVLLAAGEDVDQVVARGEDAPRRSPREGTSALLLAASNGHFELASMLLDSGADPSADAPGFTVLHVMAKVRKPGVGDNDPPPTGSGAMSSLDLVEKLAAAGADVNSRMTKNVNLGNTRFNKLGATPFILAAHAADTALMSKLAELGADPLAPNAENTTPLMAAAGVGTRSPGEDAGTEDEVVEALRLALQLGADINAVDDNGETAIHGAAYKNAPAAVEFLAKAGAKVDVWNQNNSYGWTPLIIATGYRFGNFKPSPPTIAAIREAMLAAGVAPPEKPEPAKSQEIY